MNEEYENRAEFIGTITEQIILDTPFEILQSEKALLCKVVLQVRRQNGQVDTITLFADKEELRKHRIGKGLKVKVEGVIHTYNECKLPQQKGHVIVYVRARKIRRVHMQTPDRNQVTVVGNLTKTPTFGKFGKGSSRANFILCTKDLQDGITSFIPCVAKNKMANVLCELETGEELSFIGQFQSREYIKILETNVRQEKTAFEVLVVKLI